VFSLRGKSNAGRTFRIFAAHEKCDLTFCCSFNHVAGAFVRIKGKAACNLKLRILNDEKNNVSSTK